LSLRNLLVKSIALVMIGVSATPAVALPAKTELTIHYTRFEGDYKGWNLWLWPKGGEGKAYEFTANDSFGKVAKVVVPDTANVEEIGIIVRLEEWKSKDVSQDRFITKFENGKAEIWLIQGDSTIYYSKPGLSTKIASASAKSFDQVEITLNRKAELASVRSGLSVNAGSKSLAISDVTPIPATSTNSNRFSVRLSEKIVLGSEIAISHKEFGKVNPELGGLYSTEEFEKAFTYSGDDLGFTYTPASTKFRLWAPTASEAQLVVYSKDSDKAPARTVDLTKSEKGTWTAELAGDQHLTIYNFRVKLGESWVEAVDPYARAATVNGTKGVVVDLAKTNPSGWLSHEKPKFSGVATDAVFYELHVRDLSMDPNSGIKNKGKFLGLTEANTTTPDKRTKTGIDAIVDLGITHLQLLPIYDYKTVDENRNDQFNWGYDPLNFNVPEGSYSTVPTDPLNRITELKQTIQYLHSRGIRVVMDVVYNHVFDAGSHSFELLVPGYFFRKEADGTFANGTGVGNEVASERSMASKYIVDSALYWANEYKLDGYRFDLMGILDVDTMNKIRQGVDKIDPAFLIIGEGWNMGSSLFPEKKAYQYNAAKMPRIAHFNDGIRDGLKGSVFKAAENGWASGRKSSKMEVMEGIAGEIYFSSDVRGSWGDAEPEQSVSYVEAHDNLTLFDKLRSSMPKASAIERTRVFALASSTAILAQGVTFLHAGQEFMRSKNGDENSYKSSDLVNSMKWTNRAKNKVMVSYFKGLLDIRKANSAFRMNKGSEVRKILTFSDTPADVIAYSLDASGQANSLRTIFVIHNSSTAPRTVKLPARGSWRVLAEGLIARASGIRTTGSVASMTVAPQSTMVLSLNK